MAVVPAFARQLAAGAADHPRGLPRASAYMDFLSYFMVGYAVWQIHASDETR